MIQDTYSGHFCGAVKRPRGNKTRGNGSIERHVEDNGSIHDRNGTGGMRLTMGIASTIETGLCIGECTYVCNMLILPTLTQRLLNKKNKNGYL